MGVNDYVSACVCTPRPSSRIESGSSGAGLATPVPREGAANRGEWSACKHRRLTDLWRSGRACAAFAVLRCNRRFCRLTGELLQSGRTPHAEPDRTSADRQRSPRERRAPASRARPRSYVCVVSGSIDDSFVGSRRRRTVVSHQPTLHSMQ